MEMQAGAKVWLRVDDHYRTVRKEPFEGILTKVGRKYLTVNVAHREYRFDKETLVEETDCGSHHMLYFSKEELDENLECEELFSDIRHKFEIVFSSSIRGSTMFSLDKLRRIKAILEE